MLINIEIYMEKYQETEEEIGDIFLFRYEMKKGKKENTKLPYKLIANKCKPEFKVVEEHHTDCEFIINNGMVYKK